MGRYKVHNDRGGVTTLAKKRDIEGRRVRLRAELSNGYGRYPTSVIWTVRFMDGRGRYWLEGDPCEHCKVRTRIDGVFLRDLVLILEDEGAPHDLDA